MKKFFIYINNIQDWFEQRICQKDLSCLTKALENGDCEKASDIITTQLLDTISFYDYKEDYTDILKYGLCFYKKTCLIVQGYYSPLFL